MTNNHNSTDSPAGIADDQIEELLRMEAEATPGPWFSEYNAIPWHPNHTNPFIERGTSIGAPDAGPHNVVTGGAQDEQGGSVGVLFNEDARLIVAMRNAIKPLIQRLKCAEAALDAYIIQSWMKKKRVEQLESERDRLREALEQIAFRDYHCIECATKIAAAALADAGKGGGDE